MKQKGQTLIMLLVFMVLAITITSAAVGMVIVNSQGATAIELGNAAVKLAESGIENALIRLVRDPSYTGTETLTLDGGSVTSTVSGINPVTIVSTATLDGYTRKASVSAAFTNTILSVSSWQEEY